MTIALLAAGVLTAAAGTKLAAAAFVAAAVTAAQDGGQVATVVVWSAALAAGLVVAGHLPRRVALPAVALAAAAAAGAASNAAIVLFPWILATVAAASSAGRSEAGRRWACGLAAADAPVVAAIAWEVATDGFVAWTTQVDGVPAGLLLFAALVRAPLSAGPLDRAPEPGMVAVRAQTLLLVVLALGGDPGATVARAAVLVSAAVFVAAAASSRASVRDGMQEVSLAAVALGGSALGWASEAWFWGALAAGTLTHLARTVAPPRRNASGVIGGVVAAGGLGAPWLPIVAALVVSGVSAGGVEGPAVAAGLIAGLGARSFGRRPARRGTNTAGVALVSLAAMAALWAPWFARPGAAGVGGAWPPAWGLGIVALGALAGARVPSLAPRGVRGRPTGWVVSAPQPPPLLPWAWTAGAWSAVAVVVWSVGFSRGFL